MRCAPASTSGRRWGVSPPLAGHAVLPASHAVVHPKDQMLLHSLAHLRDPNAAVSQYFNVALQQYRVVWQLLQRLYPEGLEQIRLLDFACGYGRLLRFMSLGLRPQQILASEIQADCLGFVGERFGVPTQQSFAEPERFAPARSFDVIWVASLFSHLPGHLFEAWLARLKACLSPDGVLCFSVHDRRLLPPGEVFPEAAGILFQPHSENADLETAIYGTTYVSEPYVAAAIARICGDRHTYRRFPRLLAHEQDVYVLPARADKDLGALDGFRYGCWGWVDERRLSDDGELYLRGWAASFDQPPLEAVDIWVDGQRLRCPTDRPSEDVARWFDDPAMARAGWAFRHQVGRRQGPVRIAVSAGAGEEGGALLLAAELERPAGLRPVPGMWSRLRRLLR